MNVKVSIKKTPRSARNDSNRSTEFRHFLITRLNIDGYFCQPMPPEVRNDLDYLDYRLQVFEKTCFPSVNAQSNKNFQWLFLVDAQTPASVIERIEQYNCEPSLQIVVIANKETCLQTVREAIDGRIDDATPYLITTNLDSDDIIHNDFIANVQKQFRQQDFEFINFPFGYLYQINNRRLYLREWLHASVYSLIERSDKAIDTVLNYDHTKISNYAIAQVFTQPMWLMTAHQKNVRTRFDVSAAWQPISRTKGHFTTRLDFPQPSKLAEIRDSFLEAWKVFTNKTWVDRPKVKLRKVVNIFFPSFLRAFRTGVYFFKT